MTDTSDSTFNPQDKKNGGCLRTLGIMLITIIVSVVATVFVVNYFLFPKALDPVELSKSREFYKEKRPVDLDEEMMKLSENQLMYEIAAKLMAKKFEGLKYAIDEASK